MSRFDQDREELIQMIMSICDYARLGYKISTHNNCNTCGIRKTCEYAPEWGESVRWNCPLYPREKKE